MDHVWYSAAVSYDPASGQARVYQRPVLNALTVQLASSSAGFSEVRLAADGALHLGDASTGLDVTGLSCRSDLLYSTPQDYLRSLL